MTLLKWHKMPGYYQYTKVMPITTTQAINNKDDFFNNARRKITGTILTKGYQRGMLYKMITLELFHSEVVLQRFSEVTTAGIYRVSSLQSVSNIFW